MENGCYPCIWISYVHNNLLSLTQLDGIYILFVQRVGVDQPPSQSPSTTTSQLRDEQQLRAENDSALEDVFEIERLAVLNGLTYDERMEIVHKALESGKARLIHFIFTSY